MSDQQIGRKMIEEEEERCPAMKGAKLVKGFGECQCFEPEIFPPRRARALSFRVNSVPYATPFARSAVEADHKVPTPVFEKLGSGL